MLTLSRDYPQWQTKTLVAVSSPTSPIDKPLTKVEMLARTSKSISTLTNHIVRGVNIKGELMEAKKLELWSKAGAFKVRLESENAKTLCANEKIVAQRVHNLGKVKKLEITSEIEFKMKCA